MLKLPQRDLAYKSFDAWGLLVQAYNEKLLEAAHNMLAVHTSLGSALGTGSPLRAAWHVAYHDVLEVLGAAFRAWAVVSTASTRPEPWYLLARIGPRSRVAHCPQGRGADEFVARCDGVRSVGPTGSSAPELE